MKRAALLIAAALCGCSTREQSVEPVVGDISIIPHPVSISRLGGEFEIAPQTLIVAGDDAGLLAATVLNQELTQTCGFALETTDAGPESPPAIIFAPPAETANSESYELRVTPAQITISGSPRGQFYAVQSLIQMFPQKADAPLRIPAAVITDSPRFRYRGIHLDEARHFMGAEFVKKYIRLAARYKLNYFHWHLTDDQGWRIEIKKYLRLTEKGSHRTETVVGKNYSPYVGDGKPVEGFYTQDQIREIVAFAAAHHVTIVPEIEMPGHASAALAAYPQFGCRPASNYSVKTTWGGFADVFCPSDATFEFLRDVIGEVSKLFPESPYIHVGGDEVDLTHWSESPTVAAIKQREALADDHAVLRWFVDKIGEIGAEHGKKIICWDDMIENGQLPNAVVMSWKGNNIGARAAALGREVIMTPDRFLYFDRPQGENDGRITLGQTTTYADVFNYDPFGEVPSSAVNNVIGGQGSMWTEFIKTPADAEFMAFPRMIALAEMLWSRPPADRSGETASSIAGFAKRLSREYSFLDRENINYRIPEPSGLADRQPAAGESVIVNLSSPVPNSTIYFTTDGSSPTNSSSVFKTPFALPQKSGKPLEIKAFIMTPTGRPGPVRTAAFGLRPTQSINPPNQKDALKRPAKSK